MDSDSESQWELDEGHPGQGTFAAPLPAGEEQINALLEMMPVGVGVMDRHGTLIARNTEMRAYLPTGVIPSRDSRVRLWRAFHPDGSPVPPDDFPCARALRGIARAEQDMLYTDENGRTIWTRFAAVPLRNGKGDVSGAIVTVTNIDGLKRSDLALQESEGRFAVQIARLQELQGLGDSLALSHDMQALYQMIVEGAAALMQSDSAGI